MILRLALIFPRPECLNYTQVSESICCNDTLSNSERIGAFRGILRYGGDWYKSPLHMIDEGDLQLRTEAYMFLGQYLVDDRAIQPTPEVRDMLIERCKRRDSLDLLHMRIALRYLLGDVESIEYARTLLAPLRQMSDSQATLIEKCLEKIIHQVENNMKVTAAWI